MVVVVICVYRPTNNWFMETRFCFIVSSDPTDWRTTIGSKQIFLNGTGTASPLRNVRCNVYA